MIPQLDLIETATTMALCVEYLTVCYTDRNRQIRSYGGRPKHCWVIHQ